MKKILFLFLLVIGVSSASFAQSAGKGSSSSNSKRKAHAQMKHFDSAKKDPNMKHNGTSYNRNKKSDYKVDGNGYGTGSGRQRRGKKTGIH